MKFIDRVKIYVQAGTGGNGTVAFRREAHVPKGGPSGGDGGRGGSVIFVATNSLSTLLDLRYYREYKAQNGEKGHAKKMHGADADDLVIRVPVGTCVYDDDTGNIIADLTKYAEEQDGWCVADDNREGVRVSFDRDNGDGWFLLRLSVHDPIMPLNVESDSEGGVKIICDKLGEFLKTTTGLDL